MQRYSTIVEGNPREIVLLRGRGCRYRRCAFCDYHLDFSRDEAANLDINREALAQVTGRFGILEAINSGSFDELDPSTVDLLLDTCLSKNIHTLHVECHWLSRDAIPAFKARFAEAGVRVKIKQGVETFDADFRENVLVKGIDETDPAKIAENFDECCLLFGIEGQTLESMRRDIETGLAHFERVCINVMVPNTTRIVPCDKVIATFARELAPLYRDNPRVDILMENTDFGVGTPDEGDIV